MQNRLHSARRRATCERVPSTALSFSSRDQHRAWLATQSALPRGFRVGTTRFDFMPKEAPKPAKMTLTLIALDKPTPDFAAMFTKNAFPGAPVIVGRKRLAEPALGAIIINNKISNVCAPGGVETSERVCVETAKLLSLPATAVLPSSTGVIGWGLGGVGDLRQHQVPPGSDVVRVGQHSPVGLRHTQVVCEYGAGVSVVISGDLRQRVPGCDRDHHVSGIVSGADDVKLSDIEDKVVCQICSRARRRHQAEVRAGADGDRLASLTDTSNLGPPYFISCALIRRQRRDRRQGRITARRNTASGPRTTHLRRSVHLL